MWGAVGFRKNIRDDSKDKRWVQKKFKDDVDAAKKENPSLWGFIFFTNIDLTPKEQEGLKQYAHVNKSAFYGFIPIGGRRKRIKMDKLIKDRAFVLLIWTFPSREQGRKKKQQAFLCSVRAGVSEQLVQEIFHRPWINEVAPSRFPAGVPETPGVGRSIYRQFESGTKRKSLAIIVSWRRLKILVEGIDIVRCGLAAKMPSTVRQEVRMGHRCSC